MSARLPDYVLTIYCDEASHTPEPVGPFTQGPWWLQPLDRLDETEGVFVVGAMELGRDVPGLWAPAATILIPGRLGRPRRHGGIQQLPDTEATPTRAEEFAKLGAASVRQRYRLKCGACDLAVTQRAPLFVRTLNTLAGNGISAVSLRALIRP